MKSIGQMLETIHGLVGTDDITQWENDFIQSVYQRYRSAGAKPMLANLHVVYAVFNPVYAFLDQLDNDGTMDVTTDGMAIYRATKDGLYYSFADGLEGLVEAYEIWERRSGISLNMLPLKQLVARIKYGTAITELETRSAREAVDRMRIATMRMTAIESTEMLRDFEIKEGIEKRMAA